MKHLFKATKWYLVAGVILFLFLIIFGTKRYSGQATIILDFAFTVIVTVLIAIVQTRLYDKLSGRISYEKGIPRRIILLILIFTCSLIVSMTILVFILHHATNFFFPMYCHDDMTFTEKLKHSMGNGLAMNTIIILFVEAADLFKNWKSSLIRAERLEKEKVSAELNALKSQVNPHFLFNSLNVLTAVMHEDIPKAERYIQNFSKLYRYVLNVKDKSFVPLKDEMALAANYISLQKERFGDAFSFSSNSVAVEQYHIPPLCVHELLENALKHNKLSIEHPLHIEVFTENNFIVVKNNYNPLQTVESSNLTGQENIIKRYAFLQLKKPEFRIVEGYYFARLQLLEEE